MDDADIQRYFDLANQDILKERIRKIESVFFEFGQENFYISYSGGKDSNVLSKLIDLAVPDNHIPRVFMHTGIELNAVVDFVKDKASKDYRIHIIEPQVNIKDCLEEYGYPFKSKVHARKVATYQRSGMTIGVKHYLNEDKDPNRNKYTCPERLKYQFTDANKLKISAACCVVMKESPLITWQRKMSFLYPITGMRQAEGGARDNVNCLSWTKGYLRAFNPLAPVPDDWMEWMIKTYDIDLPIVYYPPYNFIRTGCKGCPFAMNLKNELDMLEKYFPNERKQCEYIWGPVYDEYRRLNYRLKGENNE